MPTFLVCTTHWRLTNNILLHRVASFLCPKTRTSDHTRSPISSDFVTGTKIAITRIPITATVQDLHQPQYLQPYKIPNGPTDSPPPHPKKNPAHYHIAILVPHDELVMKSYMHIWLMIVETHYHNLNINIKNLDYWLVT